MIARRATVRDLYRHALSLGFRTLADDGIRSVLAGETSLDEISRVVDLTGRIV
jgi:general secretion pathway protein E/type IV pilus assembly protein PilB